MFFFQKTQKPSSPSNYDSPPDFYSLVGFIWSVFLSSVQFLLFVSITLLSCCLWLYCLLSDRYYLFWFIYLNRKTKVKFGNCAKIFLFRDVCLRVSVASDSWANKHIPYQQLSQQTSKPVKPISSSPTLLIYALLFIVVLTTFFLFGKNTLIKMFFK